MPHLSRAIPCIYKAPLAKTPVSMSNSASKRYGCYINIAKTPGDLLKPCKCLIAPSNFDSGPLLKSCRGFHGVIICCRVHREIQGAIIPSLYAAISVWPFNPYRGFYKSCGARHTFERCRAWSNDALSSLRNLLQTLKRPTIASDACCLGGKGTHIRWTLSCPHMALLDSVVAVLRWVKCILPTSNWYHWSTCGD